MLMIFWYCSAPDPAVLVFTLLTDDLGLLYMHLYWKYVLVRGSQARKITPWAFLLFLWWSSPRHSYCSFSSLVIVSCMGYFLKESICAGISWRTLCPYRLIFLLVRYRWWFDRWIPGLPVCLNGEHRFLNLLLLSSVLPYKCCWLMKTSPMLLEKQFFGSLIKLKYSGECRSLAGYFIIFILFSGKPSDIWKY